MHIHQNLSYQVPQLDVLYQEARRHYNFTLLYQSLHSFLLALLSSLQLILCIYNASVERHLWGGATMMTRHVLD